jgi:RHS repeat-associated protein
LGSASLETNENGQVISYEEYHPFGTSAYRVAKSGTDLSLKRYRFTNKERDDETGLYYFGVRYYAAWLGRWTSSDPGDFVDGLNMYVYVRNNPVMLVDEEGDEAEPPPENREDDGQKGEAIDDSDSKGKGYYYSTDGRFLGRRGSATNVYVVDTDEENLESYKNQYGFGRLKLSSKQLINSAGEAMTHEQFIDRVHYSYGETKTQPVEFQGNAVNNRGAVKQKQSRYRGAAEAGIYSSRSRSKMQCGCETCPCPEGKNPNDGYIDVRDSRKSENWDKEGIKLNENFNGAAERLRLVVSKTLEVASGQGTDPLNSYGYWKGAQTKQTIDYSIDYARKLGSNQHSIIVMQARTKSVTTANYINYLGKVSSWSFHVYHINEEQQLVNSKSDIYIYNNEGGLIHEGTIPAGTTYTKWRTPKETK